MRQKEYVHVMNHNENTETILTWRDDHETKKRWQNLSHGWRRMRPYVKPWGNLKELELTASSLYTVVRCSTYFCFHLKQNHVSATTIAVSLVFAIIPTPSLILRSGAQTLKLYIPNKRAITDESEGQTRNSLRLFRTSIRKKGFRINKVLDKTSTYVQPKANLG